MVGISTTPSFQQTAGAAGQVEVLSPRLLRCYGSAPPTESCRRGAGVAVVALPSLQGDNVMPPGLVAVATANQVWLNSTYLGGTFPKKIPNMEGGV